MSGKKDKLLRKSNQIQKKQLRSVVNDVVDRAMVQPLKVRWRLALKILMGEGKDKYLLILLFTISQLLALFICVFICNCKRAR